MSKKTAPAPAATTRRASLLAPPPEREPGIGPGMAAAIYFVLALLYFIPAFMPGRQVFGTDFSQAGYFFQDFLSRSFAAGHLPKWVPYLYGGVPLFSNAGSTYYPVRFVADWLLPVKDILPAIYLAQFFIAGWGMYLLAREMGCRPWVAFVAGLCFQWTGLLTSWVYAGHDGRIIVGSLVPLFFYFLHRGVRTARLAPFAGAAAAVGFALLSFQIQVAWYMLVGGLIWAIFSLVHLGVFRRRGVAVKVIALGVAAVAFGFAMAAVNFLPFSGYVEASPRAGSEGRGYEYSVSYSMPKAYVAGMALPEAIGASVTDPTTGQPALPEYRGVNGIKLHTEYLGATVLVLFGLGFWYARRSRYFWFFAGTGLFFLTMAFGGNTPLYHLYLAVLPGLKKFRAPDLAYCMAAFSIISMAALALEHLARARAAVGNSKSDYAERDNVSWVPAIGGGAAILCIFLAMAFVGSGAGGGRFLVFAAGVVVALWLWTSRRMATTAAVAVLALVTVADLWVIGKKYFYTIPGPEQLYAADDVTGFLQAQAKPLRVWPVQANWPITTAEPLMRATDLPMIYGIEQAGGEHGNQLQRYNEFVGEGTAANPTFENLGRDPRFRVAGGISHVVISQEVQDPSFREAFRGQQALVYQNTESPGRAWLVGQAIRAPAGATLRTMQGPQWNPRVNAVVESPRDLALAGPNLRGAARITRYEADRVEVATEANGAALLVLADNFYKDWKATVDGRPAEIYRTNHTFRGVVVPAGRHRVTFSFEPQGLATGFYVFLATIGLLLAYGLWLLVTWWRGRKRVPADAAPPEPAAA